MVTIELRGSQSMDGFQPSAEGMPWEAHVLDLRHASWVDPYGLVGTICLATRLRSQGTPVHVLVPTSDSVAMYLSRMDFEHHLEACGATLDRPLPKHRRNDHSAYLLELQPFDDTFGAERVASLIVQRMEAYLPEQLLYPLHDVVSELGNNVDEHSASPVGGFMAAQTYNAGRPNEYVIVAMGDAGIGIRQHLTQQHDVEHDADAIEMALTEYVTGTGQQGRGVGLALFVRFVAPRGTAVVHSGRGKAIVAAGTQMQRLTSHVQGTLIGASLRCRG
jgi:hypothetical protein